MTIGFIVIGGGFQSLVNFSVVASWSFYFLTVCDDRFLAYSVALSIDVNKVLGLVILRVKEPNLERYEWPECCLTVPNDVHGMTRHQTIQNVDHHAPFVLRCCDIFVVHADYCSTA